MLTTNPELPLRTPLTISTAALAMAAFAFTPVAVDADADGSCHLVRGGDTTEDASDDVEACRQDVWFHANGTQVDNLDNAQGSYAVWDTTPPAASVTSGAGNGVLANSALHQQVEPFDDRGAFVAAGTFDGAIDDVIVELYLFTPGTNIDDTSAPVVRGDYSVDAELTVDGFAVATLADQVVTLEDAGDAVQRITFAFRDVSTIMAMVGSLDGAHEVEVRVHDLAIISDAAVMVYDTTEVPAGMVFNPPAELLAEVD